MCDDDDDDDVLDWKCVGEVLLHYLFVDLSGFVPIDAGCGSRSTCGAILETARQSRAFTVEKIPLVNIFIRIRGIGLSGCIYALFKKSSSSFWSNVLTGTKPVPQLPEFSTKSFLYQ